MEGNNSTEEEDKTKSHEKALWWMDEHEWHERGVFIWWMWKLELYCQNCGCCSLSEHLSAFDRSFKRIKWSMAKMEWDLSIVVWHFLVYITNIECISLYRWSSGHQFNVSRHDLEVDRLSMMQVPGHSTDMPGSNPLWLTRADVLLVSTVSIPLLHSSLSSHLYATSHSFQKPERQLITGSSPVFTSLLLLHCLLEVNMAALGAR